MPAPWKIPLAAALLLAACAPRPLTPAATDPRPLDQAWVSTLHRGHPLTGRILDVRGARFIDPAALEAALARADVVVLGETHDNPDHHLLQARAVRAVVAAGRRPALAFEMLGAPLQPQVEAAQAAGGLTADALAALVDWPKSGWPDFALYRPVFEAGLAAGLPLVAANLPRSAAREVMRKGAEALPDDVRPWLARARPLAPAEVDLLRDEMSRDHCGELPDALVAPMVLAQRARDAQLAVRTAAAAGGPGGRGALLVAGNGHARSDRAVPAWLAAEAPGLSVVAVGHLEVSPDRPHPDDYREDFGGALPFDYLVFTPAAEREDQCAKLRRQQEERRAAPPAASPVPGAVP